MSDAATLILESLDRVAEITDDPSAQVYERLFTEYPEFKQLFRHESSGELARQNMFRVTVVALLEHLEGKHSSLTMVNSERINHFHLGVPNEKFNRYYEVVRDTFQDILGDDWTPQTQNAWDDAIDGLVGATGGWQEGASGK